MGQGASGQFVTNVQEAVYKLWLRHLRSGNPALSGSYPVYESVEAQAEALSAISWALSHVSFEPVLDIEYYSWLHPVHVGILARLPYQQVSQQRY